MSQEHGFELSEQQRAAVEVGLDRPFSVNQRAMRVSGQLDMAQIGQALRHATARHEILRTRFVRPAGGQVPLQVVAPEGRVSYDIVDELDPADVDGSIALLAARRPTFDLRGGTSAHVAVGRFSPADHLLVLSAHAAILDRRSLGLLAEELLGGEHEEDPLQYGDYAAWQAELGAPAGARDGDETTATRLPLAGIPAIGGESARTELDIAVARTVAGAPLGRPRDVWLALWVALIARSTGNTEVTMSLCDHGRPLAEVERALGPFARRLPLRIDVAPGIGLRALTQAVAVARARAERDRESLGRAGHRSTLIGFALADDVPMVQVHERELSSLSSCDAWNGLQVDLTGSEKAPILQYDSLSVGDDEATRLTARLATLAAAALADVESDVWSLDVLPGSEQRWLLSEVGRGPVIEVTEACVHHRFEDRAVAAPNAPAVAADGVELSYGELNREANRIAHALRVRGVVPGQTVAIALDRTPALIAAVLGVLKAGAAYIPINPDHPALRIRYQLKDAGATLVLVDDANVALVDALGPPALRTDHLPAGLPDHDPPRASRPDDIAYLIYTSGSTGEPKGVETTHAALGNYVTAICGRLGWHEPSLRFALVTTLSTDLGNTSVFPALTIGACLELVPVTEATDGVAYAAFAAGRSIDVLKITPTHLRALLAGGGAAVLPRKRIVIGGEALPWSLVDRVRELGECAITNHYGPTETTIGSLAHDPELHDPTVHVADTVPIGRPLANTTISVVDQAGRLVPAGAPGELLIGGPGVARGYRGRPELTAARFIADEVRGEFESRVYRTGDIVRILADGCVEFLGRVDAQVKIRGNRVELGEVEAVLTGHPAVGEAVVIVQPDPRGDQRLAAYVVTSDAALVADELREYTRSRLPEVMVPATIVLLDAFPLLGNGKLDIAALTTIESTSATPAPHVELNTMTERRLADIWREALSLERVGAEDDFFSLGGHSLVAMQVIAQIRTAFGVQLPLHSLFTAPRIVDLAREVDALLGQHSDSDAEIARLLIEIEQLSEEEAAALLHADDSESSVD